VTGKVRIVRIEARPDKFGVSPIFSEDDGLAEPVAILDLERCRGRLIIGNSPPVLAANAQLVLDRKLTIFAGGRAGSNRAVIIPAEWSS
jgi:hypothetical protein